MMNNKDIMNENNRCLYFLIIKNCTDAIISINLDGIITTWNNAAQKLYGYTPEEAINHSIFIIVPPEKHHEIYKVIEYVKMGKQVTSYETLRKTKDGRHLFVIVHISPIKDESEIIIGITAIVHDLSNQLYIDKKAQSIMNATTESIICFDKAGKINFVNKQTEKLFGYPASDLIGQPIKQLIPNPNPNLNEIKYLLFKNIKLKPIELFGKRKNSEIFPLEISFSSFKVDNTMSFVIAVRDITALKELERKKNQFISIASHELRSPLMSIQGSLELIDSLNENVSNDALIFLDIAKRNIKTLVNTVNDILSIEKLEFNKLDMVLKPNDINSIAKDAIQINQIDADGSVRKIRLIRSKSPIIINVDYSMILQVFTNLLSNAAKFSPKNKEILIFVEQHDNIVRVEVSDEGIGISEEFRSHVFEKFSQANSTSQRLHSGSGLGLSICKMIIELHGGTINFRNNGRKGATFYFDLPLSNSP